MSIQFVYRAFHTDSSSGVNSANGFYAGVQEFSYQYPDHQTVAQHFDLSSLTPTPWISTSTDLLRAIKRALQLAHRHGTDGVSIAVIDLAACQDCEYYLAADLAENLDLGPSLWHEEEFLFRWEIPENAIVCCLSLDTLENRGLYDLVPEVLTYGSVEAWKRLIRENWINDRPDRYLREVGRMAAWLAFMFGDGVHTEYIGLEAAMWWEERVGRIVKRSFYGAFRRGTENPECFD